MISAQVLLTHFGGMAGARTLLSLATLVVLGHIKGQLKYWWTRCGKKALPSNTKSLDTESAEQSQFHRVLDEDKVLRGPLDLAPLKSSEPRAAFPFTPAALRRIRLFESLDETQLEAFSHYLEVVNCPQFGHIIRQGECGEAMYLVLEGEVRALSIVEGKEVPLATFSAGQWFGEISVLDKQPRSVDVIANNNSILLKLSSESFERLQQEAPTLALHFLLVLARTLAGRLRRTNKRLEDSIGFIRISGAAA